MKNTENKQNTKRNHSLFTNKLLGLVTKAAGIEVFLVPKNESTLAGTSLLVKDCSRKAGSIQEHSSTKLATFSISDMALHKLAFSIDCY